MVEVGKAVIFFSLVPIKKIRKEVSEPGTTRD
jgi:hypothetical protein